MNHLWIRRVLIEILCSYVTLPLYALVTQVRDMCSVQCWEENIKKLELQYWSAFDFIWTDGLVDETNHIQWKSSNSTAELAPHS